MYKVLFVNEETDKITQVVIQVAKEFNSFIWTVNLMNAAGQTIQTYSEWQ